jgi:uncharacterized membrane protein YgcG
LIIIYIYDVRHSQALIKSLLFDTKAYNQGKDINYSQMKSMTKNNNFISCSYRVGSNTGHDDRSYGRVNSFFRINFTSACDDIPTTAVDWVQYRHISHTRTSCTGRMGIHEWQTGPSAHPDCNPFVSLDDIVPSRFAMAFGPLEGEGGARQQWLQISFLALDSERIGDGVDDAKFQDFGDDCLGLYMPTKHKIREKNDTEESSEEASDDDSSSGSGGGGSSGSGGVGVVNHGVYSCSTVSDSSGDSVAGQEALEYGDDDREVVLGKEKQDRLGGLFSPSVLRYLQYKDDAI